MVCGLNICFQQPIAYYFHTTLKAPDRAELITQILCELYKQGVKVVNITFDGYSSNAKMSRMIPHLRLKAIFLIGATECIQSKHWQDHYHCLFKNEMNVFLSFK